MVVSNAAGSIGNAVSCRMHKTLIYIYIYIYIYIPCTARHTIPWKYLVTLYSQTLVSLPGLTCHEFCRYFITSVTQCSSQFRTAVPIYLPWTSVFTLSRGPLWPSVTSYFSFLRCKVVIPTPSPELENCHLSCVHHRLFIVTPVHMFVSRGRLCNIDQRTPRTYEARDAFSVAYWSTVHICLLKYCSYIHMTVCVYIFFLGVFSCDSKTQVNLIYMQSRIYRFL